MPDTKELNPKEVNVIIGGNNHTVKGFVDGVFIGIVFDERNFNDSTGADGEGTRVASNNYAANITITLQQSSPSNDILSILSNVDRKVGKSAFPLTIKDNLGTTINVSTQTWIDKLPDQTYSRGVEARAWVLRTLHLESFVGGNRSAS